MAVLGDASLRIGPGRSLGYRWFTDPSAREAYPTEEREQLSRVYASGLRQLVALRGSGSRADGLAGLLQGVGVPPPGTERFLHPTVGRLDLHCRTLLDDEQSHRLLVCTAVPGSDSHGKLQLLSLIGTNTVST